MLLMAAFRGVEKVPHCKIKTLVGYLINQLLKRPWLRCAHPQQDPEEQQLLADDE